MPNTRFIQQLRRDELVAMRDLAFDDGVPATVVGRDQAFARVRSADGSRNNEYMWEMVDRLVTLEIPFPAQAPAGAR